MRLTPTGKFWLWLVYANGKEEIVDCYENFDMALDASDEILAEMREGKRSGVARVRVSRDFKPAPDQ